MNSSRGRLLLSSYYNHNAVATSNNCVIYNIARKPMDNVPQLLGLAPTSELLEWALNNKARSNWFNEYYYRYVDEVVSTGLFSLDFSTITNKLDLGIDVMLVCWCLKYDECHRRIVGSLVEARGYTVLYS